MITLKSYQDNAVASLLFKFGKLLKKSENKVCILKAPTGSGKTIICAEFLKRFVKEPENRDKFSFVWISVRKLHDQSKEKLERYYDDNRALTCSYFEDLVERRINANEILFVNWESIREEDNIIIRENEKDNNLDAVLTNTKNEGREIILIIDESHFAAKTELARGLIDQISPKITLEVSATPQLRSYTSEIEEVSLDDVKDEEMIKTEVVINPEFDNTEIDAESSTDLVLEQALKKRQELKKMYEMSDSDINPLVLIQLPDRKSTREEKKTEIIRKLQDKFAISEENGKMAVWLSETKSDTLPNIEKNNNEVEVLLFKQAIALGWDCPRASILIIFRESKSIIFTIQVIGRIMRMPEHRYYMDTPELNRAFIFTNLPSTSMEIAEDYAKDYITIKHSKRLDKLYSNVNLKSVYLKRQREKTRLSGEFVDIFLAMAKTKKLKDRIMLTASGISYEIISDGKISDIDEIGQIQYKTTRNMPISDTEYQILFNEFIKTTCYPFAPHDSGHRMKTALYQFFENEFSMKKYDTTTQKIILSKENASELKIIIDLAKNKYNNEIVQKVYEREKVANDNWEVPQSISYNAKYKEKPSSKSIMNPLYVMRSDSKQISSVEESFMNSLDDSDDVRWWFKNGESEIKYFAVPYDDGRIRSFYVDFIVYFKDGRIGLFDTKKGSTAREAGPKSNALYKYVRDNKKSKKIFGGIVIDDGGYWKYYNKPVYDLNDPEGWELLRL